MGLRIIFLLIILFSNLLSAKDLPPLYPGLSNELKKINSGGYHKWPKHSAGSYLSKHEYTPEEYSEFFRRFFKENPDLSLGFYSFIGYAVFGWFDEKARTNTQRGLCPVILENYTNYLKNGSEVLSGIIVKEIENKSVTFRTMAVMLRECVWLRPGYNYIPEFREKAREELIKIFSKKYDLSPFEYIDKEKLPGVNTYRAITLMLLAELDRENPELAITLGFNGKREEIFRKHRLFISDNAGLKDFDLNIIDSVLSQIPKEMHHLRTITVRDYLEEQKINVHEYHYTVNIFGSPKKRPQRENSFPKDSPPFDSDQFSLVVVHEINHSVAAKYVGEINKDTLYARQTQLIKEAGKNRMHYLRSEAKDGYFEKTPQEFIASMSNMWFANTERTLEVGYKRCLSNNFHPMNQALYMAEIYSLKTNTSRGFELDGDGNLSGYEFNLERDTEGKIIRISSSKFEYSFEYKNQFLSSCRKIEIKKP